MENVLRTSRLDQLGVLASSVCAVHCALGAVLAGASGLVGSLVGSEDVESVLVVSAVAVAAAALASGYRRHRDGWVVSLFVAGLSLLAIARFLEVPAIPEPVFPVIAASLLITAHARNALVLHRVRACCGPDGCATS